MTDDNTRHTDSGSSGAASPALREQEQRIAQLAGQGQKEAAKELLFTLILELARQHDFKNAQRLRDWIYEIDPMALNEIIRSGEIIDQEKSKAISQEHLEIWAELVEKLTSEEYTAIYHEMKELHYEAEQLMVAQGSSNDALLFINQGTVIVSHQQGGKVLFLNELGSGDIIGENFFESSYWTVSLTARNQCSISLLTHDNFRKWAREFPGLESKLRNFYFRVNEQHTILKEKQLDRRLQSRQLLHRKLIFQLFDQGGKLSEKGFRGDLHDISEGGLAFVIRISKKENCRLLLGRQLRITLPVKGPQEKIHLEGQIVSVQPFNALESDYGLHVKFQRRLTPEQLKFICCA